MHGFELKDQVFQRLFLKEFTGTKAKMYTMNIFIYIYIYEVRTSSTWHLTRDSTKKESVDVLEHIFYSCPSSHSKARYMGHRGYSGMLLICRLSKKVVPFEDHYNKEQFRLL